MATLALLLIIAVTGAATVYAHRRLPFHTPNQRQLRAARIILLVTGAAFGWVSARVYGLATDLNPVLIFFASLGLVHVPAAAILFIKARRPDE